MGPKQKKEHGYTQEILLKSRNRFSTGFPNVVSKREFDYCTPMLFQSDGLTVPGW